MEKTLPSRTHKAPLLSHAPSCTSCSCAVCSLPHRSRALLQQLQVPRDAVYEIGVCRSQRDHSLAVRGDLRPPRVYHDVRGNTCKSTASKLQCLSSVQNVSVMMQVSFRYATQETCEASSMFAA